MNNIKRFFSTLTFLLVIASMSIAAEMTEEQLRFRNSIQGFLKEEGFNVYVDEDDNTLNFKKEGVLYWITIGGSSRIYIEFHRSGLKCTDADRNRVLQAANMANRKVRCAKAMLGDSYVNFAIEMYCYTAEDFKYVFYQCLKELDTIKTEVYDYYNDSKSSSSQSGNTKSRRSDASANGSSSYYPALGKLFPIYGITLGKTTINDLKARGYKVETVASGARHCDLNDIAFWDHDQDNVFEQAFLLEDDRIPDKWIEEVGLDWELSYNQVLSKFRAKGFRFEVVESPKVDTYAGRKVLAAEIKAVSADGDVAFVFEFNYGNENGEGYSTDSKGSLWAITVKVI